MFDAIEEPEIRNILNLNHPSRHNSKLVPILANSSLKKMKSVTQHTLHMVWQVNASKYYYARLRTYILQK